MLKTVKLRYPQIYPQISNNNDEEIKIMMQKKKH